MSEQINTNDNRAAIRWKLLTTASAMALTAYVASTALAKAEDSDRPTLWIELGGQMESMQGLSNPFIAPFMTATPPSSGLYKGDTLVNLFSPQPDVYQGNSLVSMQRPPRFAFGEEGKITFQPEGSDWFFSAGIRYGRSHDKLHAHHQTGGHVLNIYTYPSHNVVESYAFHDIEAFSDVASEHREHHMVLDFSVGKDVGIGLLGRDGSSSFSAGVRFLNIAEKMTTTIYARPNLNIRYPGPKYTLPNQSFTAYTMTAHATRSFKGLGPSLAWTASAALAGNKQDGELALDWSINGAMIFGRQKAKTDHKTQGYYFNNLHGPRTFALPQYTVPVSRHSTRSRKVTVPNLGGSVGLSVKYPNIKFSIGYRYDTFLNAMDTGIDVAKKSNLTFNGPYASLSIGLGD